MNVYYSFAEKIYKSSEKPSIMKFKVSSLAVLSFIGIIVTILIALGMFDHPEIAPVRQTTQSYCPETISDTFNVKFLNTGKDDGEVEIVIDSEKLKFIDTDDTLIVAPGETNTLKFDIDKQSLLAVKEPIRLSYKWSYSTMLGGDKGEITCKYEGDRYSQAKLKLVK